MFRYAFGFSFAWNLGVEVWLGFTGQLWNVVAVVGFQLAAELALDADSGTAIGLLRALRGEVAAWLPSHDDDDIADDLRYVDLFIANLEARGLNTPVFQPPEPWPQD